MTNAAAPEVVVHADRDSLVLAVTDRLSAVISGAVAARGIAQVVVTGGGVGTAVLAALRRTAVDWQRVHLWWGDERFLPAGHPDRNETQARAALLDHVAVDPAKVHAMPSASDAADPETAAADYAAALAAHADADAMVPLFDVLLLGVGDDGHVASLFPEHPGSRVADRSVIGVRSSPKPPPERISLTFPAIRAAAQVWLLVAGGEKAAVVASTLSGAGPSQIPAAAAVGSDRTVWLLDQAAAADLPPDLLRR